MNGRRLNDEDIEMNWFDTRDSTRLALGGYVRPEWKTTVSYHSVRVRKLEELEESEK